MKLWEAAFELRKLYVDLDGVLADFDRDVEELTGKSPAEWKKKDGLDNLPQHSHDDSAMWEAIHKHKDFYRNLKKMPDADELWDYVLKYEPNILTAIPRRTSVPDAEEHKREWVKEHLGKHVPFFIGPYSKNKQRFSKKGYILIDDRPSNIEEWEEKGGTGILHTSAEKTIKKLKDLGL